MSRRPGPSITRSDVLDAALGVVSDEGAAALSPTRVAKALGLRTPSLYHHIRGQDALRLAVAVEGWRRLLKALPAPEGELGEALRALAWGYRSFALENPELYRVMTETMFDPSDTGLLQVMASGLEKLGPVGLAGEDALHAIRGLRAAVHGFVHLEVSEQVRLPVSADESFDWLIETVVTGILARRE